MPCEMQEVGVDAIETALGGVNATIIAYGQTGAGKTHTLAGAVFVKCFRARTTSAGLCSLGVGKLLLQ